MKKVFRWGERREGAEFVKRAIATSARAEQVAGMDEPVKVCEVHAARGLHAVGGIRLRVGG